MARTPLFDTLRRALRTVERAETCGVSPAELAEQEQQARLSRRGLLRAGGSLFGAAVAGQALSACAPPPIARGRRSREARVVIVGAGLAGLSCAYRLWQRGVPSDVFDANHRVGGRTFTLRGSEFARKLELGGEFIDSGHSEIRALAAELGLTLVDLAAAAERLEPERYFISGQRYSEAQIVELFRPLASSIRRELESLGMPSTPSYAAFSPRARELDRVSIREWLERQGASGALCALLESAYTAEYGLEAGEQSCLNLLYLIGSEPGPLRLYGESDERYTLREGNDAIALRMAQALPAPVRLAHALCAVRERADGSLLLSFSRDATLVEVVADKLVLAIPFNQLRKVELGVALSPAKQRSVSGLRYGTNAKLVVATASRPWLESGASGTSFNDVVYHQSWDPARGEPGAAGMITSFCGGKLGVQLGQGTPEEQAARFLERLEPVYPGTRAAFAGRVARFHWPSAPFFEGSYACYSPGDYTSFVGSEAEVEGNVHFCGEHTSTQAQGYMQGAVESGERVARELSTALGASKAA